MTIMMAFIYCNPISTIKKNFEKNRFERQRWKLYIPSLEFILIFSIGLIMMLVSFQNETEDEIKEKEEENNKQPSKKEKVQ